VITHMRSQGLAALVVCGVCCAAIVSAIGQAAPAANGAPHAASKASKLSPGEEVFMANCARCHTPPMTLSPRVTGAVVAHMRVRARLSRKDEELLLKYLAP
jgi:mono/diheme cytochrome c family protein